MQSTPEPRWSERLLAAWYGRWPVWPLIPLSLLFARIAAGRRMLYLARLCRSVRLPVPVVVVGNLVVGGAGKTPVVMALVEALRGAGWHPGVVSRGYGGQWRSPGLVGADTPAAACGDEALLLAQSLAVPVAVGRRRADAARLLLQAHPDCDVLICDDGLQHYGLARDVELVVIDRARGFGNRWLLPAGPLREPVQRLATVQGLLLHGETADAAAAQRLQQALPSRPRQWSLDMRMGAPRALAGGQERGWAEWAGVRVHAVAGIGHPERFFAALRARGLQVLAHAFPDHHAYAPGELSFPGGDPVLLTGKDAVKCAQPASTRYWVVPLAAELPPALLPWLIELLEKARGRKNP